MAIINSVLIGKGRGKVGNLVLSNLKGQTILKSLNSSPSNPKSEDQTTQRNKMAYTVKVWQIVFLFMANFKNYIKPLESGYNAFIRNAIKVITTPVDFDFYKIWASLYSAMDLKSNMSLSCSALSDNDNLIVTIYPNEFVYNNSLSFEALFFNSVTKEFKAESMPISIETFQAREFTFGPSLNGADKVYFYISSTATKQNTELIFSLI